MAWFEIEDNDILAKDYLSGTMWGTHECWGQYIGGRWCLDYTWKLMFNISDEDWNGRCSNLISDKDFYNLCEWLGIYYMKDNVIYRKGEKYDKYGNKI